MQLDNQCLLIFTIQIPQIGINFLILIGLDMHAFLLIITYIFMEDLINKHLIFQLNQPSALI